MSRIEPSNHGQGGEPANLLAALSRPALAPNVRLIGELKETGFTERQWLIQRDGRFFQLTELLYRVAEQVDGERTLEEIAAGVTDSTDWLVSADDVRRLLQAKLIPLGLVTAKDGAAVASPGEVERRPSSSPLAFGLRVPVLGPRIIDPVTKVLQVLFAPVVLIPMLIAIVVAHGWLYLVHGVWGSIREVLYAPGLMLVVLALAIAAGVFHEFGHAAALRYGGGKPGGIGAGIYLIYPAFYTDTTDNYRLGRWARVRTDLGGFYFHLTFALGVIALFLVTGQEFLLFFVLLVNLNIIYQCLPFVRFDGYWVLADLTGIPDFFSQMGAFLRSVLPIRRWKGEKLPNLKPWVKVVFAAYVVVTVPVLAILLYFFVTRLPDIATTAWSSMLNQAAAFSRALEVGSYLGMAVSFSQALLLGMQMLGIAYLLYALGAILVRLVWNWSELSLARRVTGALIAAGVVAFLTYLWAS